MLFPILYKYLRKEHALSFIKAGTVKVGTLYGYRNVERHGTEIGDHKEGTKVTICTDPAKSFADVETHPILSKFIRAAPGAQININNAQFRIEELSPNYYIYSMAEHLDPDIARNMGYDACLVINQPQLFLLSIDECLRPVTGVKDKFILERCQYTSRTQLFSREHNIFPNIEHQVHPALIKDGNYSYQKEVRAIWEPMSVGIEPIIIQCPQAVKYCELSNDML